MILIIGGTAQGKLCHAHTLAQGVPLEVDGASCPLEGVGEAGVFYHLHHFIRRALCAGVEPWPLLEDFLERYPNAVVVCDEVGSGVVPMAPEERLWREAVGRICCTLAERAERVDRVFCGIATTLKEGVTPLKESASSLKEGATPLKGGGGQ